MGSRRVRAGGLLVVVLAVLLGACSDKPEAGKGGSVTTATTVAGGGPVTDYCGLARLYAKAFERFGQGGTALDVRSYYRDATQAMAQAQKVAPAEIKADLDVVADGLRQLVAGLDTIGYDFTKAPSLPPALITRLMAKDFVDASSRVAAYSRDKCKIS